MTSTDEGSDVVEQQSTTDYLLAPLEPGETADDVVAELHRRHATASSS